MSYLNFIRVLLVVVAGPVLLFGCAGGDVSASLDFDGGGTSSGLVANDAGSDGGGNVTGNDAGSDGAGNVTGNDVGDDASSSNDTGVQDGAADASIARYGVGGTVSGLSGTGLVLQDNGGDNLPISASGLFTFPKKIADQSPYKVTVLTQPTGPAQSCVVGDGSGTVSGADVTNVTITCTTSTFTVGGTITGLAASDASAGSAVILEDNGGDDLTVGANGTFVFATSVASGAIYSVTVKTQPTAPAQTCTVSGGVGTVGTGNVGSVVVNCAIDTFTVGGTISGLAGTVVLQDNGGNNVALNANGNFAFSTPLPSGAPYVVTVLTQPGAPSQTCVVTNGTGNVADANVTDVSVACTTNTFTVGGTLSGLASGDSVVLQDDGGDNLTLHANGTFTFATPVASGGAYSVTVLSQPGAPTQACVVSGGSGSIGALNVGSVAVTCSTSQFTVGGMLKGLAAGNSVVLQDNGGDSLTLSADGSFTFATPVASGVAFAVTVATQPGAPAQTCTVGGGTGTIGASNVTSVSVNCGTNVYTVGGTVSGLSGTVVLRDNEGDNVSVSSNGSFAFATALASGTAYAVTVQTQPSSPAQTCVVTQGSGTITNAPVTSVIVTCTTLTFTIGGTVTGLDESVVLQDNGGDNLTVSARGSFTFPTPVASGQPYIVTVLTNPASPVAQTCTVSAASGNVAAAAVTSVVVSCTTNAYAVSATVAGLAPNDTVVLQDNASDTLSITGNGTFTFPTAVGSGSGYAVLVSSQPGSPIAQTCAVTGGSGTVTNAPISVTVTCSTTAFTVGGTLAGLGASDTVVLQDNLGDNLTVGANGAFTFATPVPSGKSYAVSVLTDPTSPIAQLCTVSAGQGTVGNGNVTSVLVNCTTSSFAVGGMITGLAGSVVLQDNGGDNLTLASNGAFAFATPIASGSTYAVTVLTNPSSPVQTCVVAQGAGTVGDAAASVQVTCTTSTFTVGGTLSGLAPGESLSLVDNGGSTLTLTANGTFSFATATKSGATYAVTVSSQPSTPAQTCVVTSGSGTVSSSAITTVNVSCTGFGATCPTGTVYTESWVSDPFVSGRWTDIVGTETYNPSATPLSESLLTANPTTQMWIGARPSWANYTVSVPVRIDSSGSTNDNGGINFRMQSVGTGNNDGAMYFAGIGTNQVLLGVETSGNWNQFAANSGTYNVGTFYTLQVVVSGSTITVSVNGGNTITYTSTTYATGSFGLRAYSLGMTYGPVTVTCD